MFNSIMILSSGFGFQEWKRQGKISINVEFCYEGEENHLITMDECVVVVEKRVNVFDRNIHTVG